MRRFLRATYYFAGTVFFLGIAVAGLTQTKTFREYLHGRVTELLSQELHAEVRLGSLEGNLATGLRVDNVTLSESGQQFFHADRLEATYEPIGILLERITFSNIRLTNPRIRFLRSRDGTWNVDRIFPASQPDSLQQKPSGRVVNLRNVQLENAEFILVDSLKMQSYDSLVAHGMPVAVGDYPTLAVRGMKLNASARIASQLLHVTVQHLSFVSEQPDFVLSRLSGEFELNSSAATVRNLAVETSESKFTADASIQQVDLAAIFNVNELEQKPVRANISLNRLSLAELRRFFPSALKVLDKDVAVQATIAGTFDKLQIEQVSVRTPRSFVNIEGSVMNLHRPEALEMDLVAVNNTLDPAEFPQYLPSVELPNMTGMGVLEYNARFTGTPTAFTVRFEGKSDAGSLIADGSVEMKHDSMSYDARVTTSGLNLGAMLGDDALTSSFYTHVAVTGTGTDLQSMTATARIELDSSEFRGIPLGPSTVTASVGQRMLQAHSKFTSGKTTIDLSGTARFQRETISNYELKGTISSLDLAPILNNEHYASDLSFGIDLKGKGTTLGDMQSKLNLAFASSVFSGQSFEDSQVEVELDALDPVRQSFHLSSDIADIDIEGRFQLDSFIATLQQSSLLIAEAIEHRLGSLNFSNRVMDAGNAGLHFQSSLQYIPQQVDATYSVVVKDFFPLGVLLGYRMAGSGVISGKVSGSLDALELNGSTGLDAFAYADSTINMSSYGTDLTYHIENISRAQILDEVQVDLDFTSKQFDVNAVSFSSPSLSVNIQGPDGSYTFKALVDSSVGIEAVGTSLYRDRYITYTLEKLIVDAESYRFANNEPVVATLGKDGLHIGSFWMRHGVEEVKVAGIFNPADSSDMEIQVVNFLLSNMKLFSGNKAFIRDVQSFGGTVNAKAGFRGTFRNPNFTLDLAAHDVRHGQTAFGQVVARATYNNRLLDLFVELRNKPSDLSLPPDFVLSGFLPYDLSLANRSQRPLTGEMNLAMRSRGLHMELIDPFIGELSNLTGTMVCDVTIRGTLQQPRYEGSLAFHSAQFLFTPVGITYIVDGQLIPAGQRIALQNFRVSNIQQDRPEGGMDFSGSITLDGLKLKDFDLLANGELLLMKESARQPGQAIYGNIFAAMGPNGLRWQGTPQRSVVSGKIYVKNANLTLPPARDILINTNRDVTITVVDDTSQTHLGRLEGANTINGLNGNGSALFAMNNGAIPLNGRIASQEDVEDDGRSFFDRLVYDLDIETQGPTYVRFIFNPYTGEELFADLKGRMAFSKNGNQTRLTGEVEVGDRSYYNFLKRFQATGKLTFTGDALNPELSILAKYESPYQRADTTQTAGTGQTQSLFGDFNVTRVIVLLEISGTRQEPKPKFGIELVDGAGVHKDYPSGDVESEAITFILTGSFRDELTQQERSSLLGTNLLYGLTSSVLSGPITEFIKREFGFISSVDVMYYGGDVQSSTDVRVTGEVGEAVIRFGGRVFSDIGNANASVQLPMSSVLGSDSWRNLIIEVERRVEGMESFEQRRELNGVRLIYRITF
ncbi:MAG TPA: hypothetical protein VIL52_08735 [Bacteroidota bacterium]